MSDDAPQPPVAPERQSFPVDAASCCVRPDPATRQDATSTIPPLDVMAFAQLFTAAKQAGLGVNTDLIVSVRDHEFRVGRYQKAFDVIEGLYMQMNAEAARRRTELRQEEIRYKSGALKMTPKEWLARQRRETEKTQRIDLARRHFTRVLDALTVLRAAARPEQEQRAASVDTEPPRVV